MTDPRPRKQESERVSSGRRYFIRLNASEKMQHMLFGACFLILVVTGFMLRIPDSYLDIFGPFLPAVFKARSLLHRAAGTVMILVSLYHVYYLLVKPAGRRWFADMRPTLRDAVEMFDNFRYYLGMRDQPPEFDRFCYKHKLEYGALIAGTTIMSITGILLWTESWWSKFYLDVAMLVHGMEAILASLAIMVWHLYDVHLKPHKFPIDNMWITGLIDETTMKEEYRRHYDKIMADPRLKKIYIYSGDQRPKTKPESREDNASGSGSRGMEHDVSGSIPR